MKVIKESKYYTNGINRKLIKDGEVPPEGYYPYKSWNAGKTKETDERIRLGSEKSSKVQKELHSSGKITAWNKGLTKENDPRVAANTEASKQGMKNKYGVENPSQLPGYKPWNTGLTKETNNSVKIISDKNTGKEPWNKGKTADEDSRIIRRPHPQEERDRISKTHSSPEFKEKRYNIMKANGTLGLNSNTKIELYWLNYFKKKYGDENVIHTYFDKDRYPFKCDIYVIPEDLFVEVHGSWTHGGMPYDANNPKCIEKLNTWKEKAKTSDYYKQAIKTWTIYDPKKAEVAKNNNLNFLVIY